MAANDGMAKHDAVAVCAGTQCVGQCVNAGAPCDTRINWAWALPRWRQLDAAAYQRRTSRAAAESTTGDKCTKCTLLKQRDMLVEYMASIVVHDLKLECGSYNTFFVGVYLLDALLSAVEVPNNKLQCAGMTALCIAHKYDTRHSYYGNVRGVMEWCPNAATRQDVVAMEYTILGACDYNLHVPTAWDFAHVALCGAQSCHAGHIVYNAVMTRAVWFVLMEVQRKGFVYTFTHETLGRAAVQFVQRRAGCTCALPHAISLGKAMDESLCVQHIDGVLSRGAAEPSRGCHAIWAYVEGSKDVLALLGLSL